MSNSEDKSLCTIVSEAFDSSLEWLEETATDIQKYAEETYDDITSYEVTITKKPTVKVEELEVEEITLTDTKYPY
jgi:hypothetical protein